MPFLAMLGRDHIIAATLAPGDNIAMDNSGLQWPYRPLADLLGRGPSSWAQCMVYWIRLRSGEQGSPVRAPRCQSIGMGNCDLTQSFAAFAWGSCEPHPPRARAPSSPRLLDGESFVPPLLQETASHAVNQMAKREGQRP